MRDIGEHADLPPLVLAVHLHTHKPHHQDILVFPAYTVPRCGHIGALLQARKLGIGENLCPVAGAVHRDGFLQKLHLLGPPRHHASQVVH